VTLANHKRREKRKARNGAEDKKRKRRGKVGEKKVVRIGENIEVS